MSQNLCRNSLHLEGVSYKNEAESGR